MVSDKRGKDAGEGREHRGSDAYSHRLKRLRTQGMKPPIGPDEGAMQPDRSIDCGWGRVVFGQTFSDTRLLIETLRAEGSDRRDIAIYVRDPHVVLATAPQEIFLDPSHTYRLDLSTYRAASKPTQGFFIRRLTSEIDAQAINRIYAARGMVQVRPDFFWRQRDARSLVYFVAEDEHTGEVLGTVTGIDHVRVFNDPEKGASLWCLASDPQARHRGIGEALVRRLAEHFIARGAAYLDLSVLHDNDPAIGLYEKLGFRRVPFFTIKRKNQINEKLFTGPEAEDYEALNPYARLIVTEARRRGISVEITDAAGGFFRLSQGGRSVHCRESLSELTSATAMSICDDKSVTRRFVEQAGVAVPRQMTADAGTEAISGFLEDAGALVVKPARGEQGRGISVGVTTLEEVGAAVEKAKAYCDTVLIEEMVEGEDLRLIVINFRLVAAAIRRPAHVVGDGRSTVEQLIAAQSARRAAATGGESNIPLDAETERTVRAAGYTFADVPREGEDIRVRRTANLHTGGTIHDVTDIVHPRLVDAAVKAARAIDIPVVGIDLMVKSPQNADYAFIEANERPGLANHEPQPTAERFVDLLFPLSMPAAARASHREIQKQE
ncbi:N-acetylglutaminylglutamine synthetase [Martelella alba]|uniref:N-acetylglutaminylglutamine synthetase n=1 Tax=Martelella alba TaxID=2590451 RepID=A0A506U2Z0_9HYPH|nr:N-acetylglutaminylglutamine synthetase [Martelella alba]TPW27848.1 N-acetylglutaminylglutamine synthetase [Martelella alba]